MSLLQIKKLEAPEQICRSSLFSGSARPEASGAETNTDDTESNASTTTTTVTANITNDLRDEGVFTCHFSRPVVTDPLAQNTDFPPPNNPEEIASLAIKVSIYDENYSLINETNLNVISDNIPQSNDPQIDRKIVRFRLVISDFTFEQYGGSNIYVHVVIDNNAENAQNVSFKRGFSENFHETIKGVYLYDEQSIESVCWSTQSLIPATGDSELREQITLNEDAYIHIRTRGLSGETVIVRIYAKEADNVIALARIIAPIQHNRKVVTVSMKFLLSSYYLKKEKKYDENNPPLLYFFVKVEYDYHFNIKRPLRALLSPPPLGQVPQAPQVTMLRKESANLLLNINTEPFTPDTSYNGTVYFQNRNAVDVEAIEPDRYQDFLIGYMCHIEGVGKLAVNNSNTTNITAENPAKQTVYPLHTYEIMLSDLVACGLVTLEEAIYFSANSTQDFDKTSATLNSDKKLLISIFIDNKHHPINDSNQSLANNQAIRKVLTQVRQKDDVFANHEDNNILQHVCRDSWGNSNKRVETRYDTDQECPFGEFFINYVERPKFSLFIARGYNDKDYYAADIDKTDINSVTIHRYNKETNVRPISPNQENTRQVIAFHRGRANASTGCITFNVIWYTNGTTNNYTSFNNQLYPENNNVRKLNFVCIDERNATTPSDDLRYYDLKKW